MNGPSLCNRLYRQTQMYREGNFCNWYFCLLFERIICIRKYFPFQNLAFRDFLYQFLSLKVSIAGTSPGVCSLIGRGIKRLPRNISLLCFISFREQNQASHYNFCETEQEVIGDFYRAVWKVGFLLQKVGCMELLR